MLENAPLAIKVYHLIHQRLIFVSAFIIYPQYLSFPLKEHDCAHLTYLLSAYDIISLTFVEVHVVWLPLFFH